MRLRYALLMCIVSAVLSWHYKPDPVYTIHPTKLDLPVDVQQVSCVPMRVDKKPRR